MVKKKTQQKSICREKDTKCNPSGLLILNFTLLKPHHIILHFEPENLLLSGWQFVRGQSYLSG